MLTCTLSALFESIEHAEFEKTPSQVTELLISLWQITLKQSELPKPVSKDTFVGDPLCTAVQYLLKFEISLHPYLYLVPNFFLW